MSTIRLNPTVAIKEAAIPRAHLASVDALLEGINRRLATLTEAEAAKLWPVIEDALQGLTDKLARTPDATWTAYQAQVHRLQLKRMKAGLADKLHARLTETTRTMQTSAIVEMRNEVAALSMRFGQPRALDIDTIQAVGDTSKLLAKRLMKASTFRSAETLNDISKNLASAAAQGMSFSDAAKLLKERMGAQESNTLRLARTELVNAHNAQRHETAVDQGCLLLWNAATYRSCAICKAMDGQKIQPGVGMFRGEGVSVVHSPAHPNCRCACVLWRKEWD